MVKKYRQIPVELEAIQWDGNNVDEIKDFLNGGARVYAGCLFVTTSDGEKPASSTDYITKSGSDNFPIIRIVEAGIFEKVYEEI